ncbi:hypothetical protein Rhal01_02004 [Rubritalea halochordaticola]|uniref:DUF4130 domain-containing protein n=1 Tax=Rubritalea halochordaticola TaxID=714537 RepID=A0ABP9UZM9_9BACT
MRVISVKKGFKEWRAKARQLLVDGVRPHEVMWVKDASLETMFVDTLEMGAGSGETETFAINVPKQFIALGETVGCHRMGRQWPLLYDVLWRITREGKKGLLDNEADDAVRELKMIAAAVRRDIHKMRAFVRFRHVDTLESGREVYVSWFEPEHLIVRANAPFFQRRFAGMDWSILTPDECVSWDGKQLSYTPGVDRSVAPSEDNLEDLWRTYYRSTFNPARVKIKMMQSEMPKKYWKNLPEAEIIQQLIAESDQRVRGMMEEEARPLKPEPKNEYLNKLRKMGE